MERKDSQTGEKGKIGTAKFKIRILIQNESKAIVLLAVVFLLWKKFKKDIIKKKAVIANKTIKQKSL